MLDVKYEQNIKVILDKNKINNDDMRNLNIIYNIYDSLDSERDYEDYIEDIYILYNKVHFSLEELAKIYKINKRIIKKWIQELDLDNINSDENSIFKNNSSYEKDIDKKLKIKKVTEKDNPKRLDDFLSYLKNIKGRSPQTINGYKSDLRLLFKYLIGAKENKENIEEIYIGNIDDDFLEEITLTDLYDFLSYTENIRSNSTYSRTRKVAAIKSFFKFLFSKLKVISENISLELESPKIEKRLPIHLTLEQAQKVLNSMDKGDLHYYRDYCILTLFLNCGMRLSELCGIKISDIRGDLLTIIGKGNKQRTVYLNSECLSSIDNYLKVRVHGSTIEDDKYLFISRVKKRINKRSVERLVKKHIENAGFTDKKYTPHKLRHSAATILYKHGHADIRSLQEILGHENISTTQLYTHVDNETLRNIAQNNPLSKKDY